MRNDQNLSRKIVYKKPAQNYDSRVKQTQKICKSNLN